MMVAAGEDEGGNGVEETHWRQRPNATLRRGARAEHDAAGRPRFPPCVASWRVALKQTKRTRARDTAEKLVTSCNLWPMADDVADGR
eukprot:6335468-Prymnesium_polylepis.1